MMILKVLLSLAGLGGAAFGLWASHDSRNKILRWSGVLLAPLGLLLFMLGILLILVPGFFSPG